MEMNAAGLSDEKKALLDRVAALTLAGDDAFLEVVRSTNPTIVCVLRRLG